MKLNLTPESLRALLVLEHTLNDLQDVLSLTLKVCRKHKALAGVPELLDLLQRFEADLDKAHPCDRYLPGPIAANCEGSEDAIDLTEPGYAREMWEMPGKGKEGESRA